MRVSVSEWTNVFGTARRMAAPIWGLTSRFHFVRDDATDEVWSGASENSHQVVELLLREGREGHTKRMIRKLPAITRAVNIRWWNAEEHSRDATKT